MADKLQIHDWDDHQSYRKDRKQPPWIKLHRETIHNLKWIQLTDAQRGQIVSLWMLAANDNGRIPNDAALISKACFMTDPLDLQVFVDKGFIEGDANVTPACQPSGANMTPSRRQSDALEAYKEEADKEAERERERENSPSPDNVLLKEKGERRQIKAAELSGMVDSFVKRSRWVGDRTKIYEVFRDLLNHYDKEDVLVAISETRVGQKPWDVADRMGRQSRKPEIRHTPTWQPNYKPLSEDEQAKAKAVRKEIIRKLEAGEYENKSDEAAIAAEGSGDGH